MTIVRGSATVARADSIEALKRLIVSGVVEADDLVLRTKSPMKRVEEVLAERPKNSRLPGFVFAALALAFIAAIVGIPIYLLSAHNLSKLFIHEDRRPRWKLIQTEGTH